MEPKTKTCALPQLLHFEPQPSTKGLASQAMPMRVRLLLALGIARTPTENSTRVMGTVKWFGFLLALWMDKILPQFETIGNHCLLVFTGESHHSRVSERWCETEFASIHCRSINPTKKQFPSLTTSGETWGRIFDGRDGIREHPAAATKDASQPESKALLLNPESGRVSP